MAFKYYSCEEKACVGWIQSYFNDCVCNLSSEISFGLGMVSLVCWGFAQVPQIITNFQNKSGHGVSLAFLLTWAAGDIFNLVGCLLEPVTLPTQFYTALLYTATTLVLVLQTLYYDYWRRWLKSKINPLVYEEDTCKPLDPNGKFVSQTVPTSNTADVYYTSLASSGTPSYRPSYLAQARSGPSAPSYMESSGSDEDGSPKHKSPGNSGTIPKTIALGSVGYGTFVAGSVCLPFQAKASTEAGAGLARERMQKRGTNRLQGNAYGQLLGWIMAAIYMGSRLPQIFLNITRASVEGLNPLMFVFALVANAAYAGSILLRSVEWEMTKANAPWLLDAIVCVFLDLFIITQYVYYKFMSKKASTHEEEYEVVKAKESLI